MGAEAGGWSLTRAGWPARPDLPNYLVFCPAGSREELVERLQTYTRQVSGGGGTGQASEGSLHDPSGQGSHWLCMYFDSASQNLLIFLAFIS